MTETVDARNASLDTLATVLREQNGRKLDLVVPAAQLRMTEGNLVLRGTEVELTEDGVTPTEGVYEPTRVFDEGIADKLGVPIAYLRKLRREAIDLYDANVNGLLHGRKRNRGGELEVIRPGDERSFYVRLFRGDDGLGVARALLSNSYRAIDNFDILTAALQGIKDSGTPVEIRQCDLTDRRMYVDVFAPAVADLAPVLLGGYRNPFANPQIAAQRRGTSDVQFWQGVAQREGMGYEPGTEPVVFAGFRVSNSEVGGGAFSITPKLLVKVCRNGLVLNQDTIREVHLGGRQEDGIVKWSGETLQRQLAVITSKTRDAVATFLDVDYLRSVLEPIEAKAGTPVDAPEKVIKAVARQQGYTQAEQEGILAHFVQGGQMTAGGLLNAVTSFSQTVGDADRADTLDRDALKVLSLV